MDLKVPYLGWSRFLCSQQPGPGHLGSMPQENMQHTTNLFFLWLPPKGRWLGRYQSRKYDAAKSRSRRTKGLAGMVELHFRTWYRDKGSLYLLRTHNDVVFQLADYLGTRWQLLIYPLYIWLTGSKFTCNRLRKQGTTEQVAIICAAFDPKRNNANKLC